MATKNHSAARSLGRVGRLRERLAAGLYRGQLGPSREADVNRFVPSRTWHNHRSI
jgi:hypothetical protein